MDRHEVPEVWGVVRLPDMRQFMNDQVIDDDHRRLNDAPVEGQGPARGAGTPPIPELPHADAPIGNAHLGSQSNDARHETSARLREIPSREKSIAPATISERQLELLSDEF